MSIQKKVLQKSPVKTPPGKERELLQWHPAFFAGIQIELADEAANLIFEQEHALSSKPMGLMY